MKKGNHAYASYIGAMLIFGTIGIFRRFIPFSSGLLAFSRGVLGGLMILAFLKLTHHKTEEKLDKRTLGLLALSGALMGLNWMFLFEAYNATSVAIATLCYYMQPTIVILLSPLLFKEKLTGKKLMCAVVSLVGMMLVSGVFEGTQVQGTQIQGVLYGLTAAMLYSMVVILNKKVHVSDSYQKTTVQLFSAALVMIPYLACTERIGAMEFDGLGIVMLAVVGIVHTGVAYVLYFGSLEKLSSQSIAVLGYIDPVSALILSALILHESLSILGLMGAVLIIGAALVSEVNVRSIRK